MFGKGKWKPPVQGETVHKIDKQIYCARTTCGWTTGSAAHSTGKHKEYTRNPDGFSLAATHPYKIKLLGMEKKPAQDGNLQASSVDDKKQGSSMGLAALNTEASAFAGQFAVLLTAMSMTTVKY